jgi:hypothetical protein
MDTMATEEKNYLHQAKIGSGIHRGFLVKLFFISLWDDDWVQGKAILGLEHKFSIFHNVVEDSCGSICLLIHPFQVVPDPFIRSGIPDKVAVWVQVRYIAHHEFARRLRHPGRRAGNDPFRRRTPASLTGQSVPEGRSNLNSG